MARATTFGKVVSVVLAIMAFIMLIGVFARTEEPTPPKEPVSTEFYIKVQGEKITDSVNGYTLLPKGEMYVEVHNAELYDGYSIKVVPATDLEKNFEFTVDGELVNYQSVKELTAGFKFERDNSGFKLSPRGGVNEILSSVYPGRKISDCREKAYENMYVLEIRSKTGDNVIRIGFSIEETLYDLSFEIKSYVF